MWGGEARGQAQKPPLRGDRALNQFEQEIKALSNMLVGIPGGATGVAMDIGSRASSLAIGEDAKAAGVRARATAENTNALWGKVTGALGLTQDASGSKIEEWMGKGMEWSDVQGAQAEAATGGVVSKETVQSVRDTLLNALGVRGLSPKGIVKGRAPKPGEGTADALSADAAIRESKVRVAESAATKAVEEVAAGKAKAETVQRVYEQAIKNRTPLEDAWAGKAPKAEAGSSPAWDKMVRGLVEEPKPAPEGPGLTPKTKLAEPTVIGQAPDLVESGISKLREGKLISTPEAKAIRALKPLPDQGVIVGPNGKPYFQRGAVDPSLLKVLGLMGVGAVAGTALYNWWQSSGGLSGDNARDVGLGTGAALAALVAGKGPVGKSAQLGAIVLRKSPTIFDKMSAPELVAAMKAGGKEAEGAARAIHDATRTKLERSLYSFKDKIDVEDVVQEVYKNTFQAMSEGKFRGDSALDTYMYRTAQNLALNAARNRKTTPEYTAKSALEGPDGEVTDIAETLSSEGTRSPEEMLNNQQMIGKMQAAIEKLPEDQRNVFEMAEIDGMPYEDIATQLDIPIGTVRSRLARARDNLQQSLRAYKPERQSGKVDQGLLETAGLAAGGALLGAGLADDGSKGAIVGALTGLIGKGLYGTAPGRAAVMRGTTRLSEVLPELRRATRDMEVAASKEVSAASEAISSFIKPAKALSKEQYAKLDAAYSAADPVELKAAMQGAPELEAGYTKVREFLRKTETTLKSFGRFKEGIPDYLPLMVKDYKGLMEVLGQEVKIGLDKYLSNANLKSLKERGTGLNEVEKSLLVNDYLIRDPATSYLPGFAKHRRLKMTDATRPFYHTMEDALIHYAHAAVEDIAEAKFFGKDLRTSRRDGQQYTNLDNSIGAFTHRAMEEGRMTPEQAVEVQAVLRARFGKGKQAPSGWLQDVRNVSGVALLGQVGSGLIQTSEGLLSTYHHGIRPAVEAAGMLITRKGIKPSEFGLANHVIEEVIGKRPTGQALSLVLKANLLATLDQLGMSQNLTASFVKNRRLAETPAGQAKLTEKWGADYGPDMPQLIRELQASSTKSRTPLVDSLLYQELSDVRPTSRMEATELYNAHPNARMMYHLKQFMLTQADVMYRDAFKKIKSGNPKQVAVGLKNLALYSAALSVAVIPSDAIKNWVMGRGLKLDKIDYVDNFIRNFGLSRYTSDKIMASKTPGEAVITAGERMLTPPAFSVGKTLMKGVSDPKELAPLVPLGGRIAYNRYLGGNEKAATREKAQARIDLRDASEERNPALKAARLRKAERAKKKAARNSRSGS
jgi:RNA polymerase sigma-70 factor (ECF subfamily)